MCDRDPCDLAQSVKAYCPHVRLCVPCYPCFQAGLLVQAPHKHGASGHWSSHTRPSALPNCKAGLLSPGNREDTAQTAPWCQVSRQLYFHTCAKTSPYWKGSATFSPALLHSCALPAHCLAASPPLYGCFNSSILSLASAGLYQLQTKTHPSTSAPVPPWTISIKNSGKGFALAQVTNQLTCTQLQTASLSRLVGRCGRREVSVCPVAPRQTPTPCPRVIPSRTQGCLAGTCLCSTAGHQHLPKAWEDRWRPFPGKGHTSTAEAAALRSRLDSSFTLKSLI